MSPDDSFLRRFFDTLNMRSSSYPKMRCCFVQSWALLVFLLIFVGFGYGQIHYYVTPSVNETCPHDSFCITLPQLVANGSTETELSLVFLPGTHILEGELSLDHRENISLVTAQFNETVYVKCVNQLGRLVINGTTSVTIKSLHFIGCEGNRISRVRQIVLENSTFQGVEGSGAALLLNEVTSADIFETLFVMNLYHFDRVDIPNIPDLFNDDIILGMYISYKQYPTFMAGRALYMTFSNVSIFSSKFLHNGAEIGGAVFAESSILSISNSTFSHNIAIFGGTIVSSRCSVYIDSSTFVNNSADVYGGILISHKGLVTINNAIFANNNSSFDGGVLSTFTDHSYSEDNSSFTSNRGNFIKNVGRSNGSSINIANSIFTANRARRRGGVIKSSDVSLFTIMNSSFMNNGATSNADYNFNSKGGVIYASGNSVFTIKYSTFVRNSAKSGGVIETRDVSSFNIAKSVFTHNVANYAGVVHILATLTFTLSSCTFTCNEAQDGNGGVAIINRASPVIINSCLFTNNTAAVAGGVIWNEYTVSSSVIITGSTFANNSATVYGGVIDITAPSTIANLSYIVKNSSFVHNSARYGGVMSLVRYFSINISLSNFTRNRATVGGVFWCFRNQYRPLTVSSSGFNLNRAVDHGGVMFTMNCFTHITNSTFDHNFGSFYLFSSNVTFSGRNTMEHFAETRATLNRNATEGGVITMFQSTAIVEGECTLSNNHGSHGGAILATESSVVVYGELTVANNMVPSGEGGGVFLQQSRFEVHGWCIFTNNTALRGGGVHATGSSVVIHHPGTLIFTNNAAENGSGIYLKTNTKLYILKTGYRQEFLLQFFDNHAKYGGAMYVADDVNSGVCSANVECFIQILALYQFQYRTSIVSIWFFDNVATEYGDNLFGGLLDRCVPSPFAEVYKLKYEQRLHYSGVTYLGNTSNVALDSIASLPVRVCFCSDVGQADCSYQPPTIRVRKGELFNVSVVVVDQVNHTVDAQIVSSLSSAAGGFGEGQQTQRVQRNCTDVIYNVYSPRKSEIISIYADGPCGNAAFSTCHLTIHFEDCTCPVGFQPRSNHRSATNCECVCDSALYPYITNCDAATGLLLRLNTRSWISYLNDTDPPGFVIHPNCPFDYCYPPTSNITINFNSTLGEDRQCANGRRGVLCGACQDNLSLSLGSSRCLSCPNHWPALFVAILLAAIIAGILLVAILLALNMTVAVGLMNGFIFYANIVSANGDVFFPSSEPSFPSVIIAWLNLDFGFDVCFFDGLDAYSKTWLPLAFTTYIISLVMVVIVVGECSPKFARLIGKKDPIATLATLVLLSYSKLLSATIEILSFAILHLPDDSQEVVWLLDGNIGYFHGKHIPLVFVAIFIILIGIPYTVLLLLWQWIVRAPRWKLFQWTRNTKLNAFINAYHAPYSSKHRYWTGLLLLVRVVLYVIASVTVSSRPQVSVLVTIVAVGCLLLLKAVFGLRVYKKSLVDILDTVLYFNLLTFAVFSLYDFKASVMKQTAVAYTSVAITFVLLIIVVCYQVYQAASSITCKRSRIPQLEVLNERLLARVNLDKPVITHSVVDLPKLQSQPMELMPKTIEAEALSYQ